MNIKFPKIWIYTCVTNWVQKMKIIKAGCLLHWQLSIHQQLPNTILSQTEIILSPSFLLQGLTSQHSNFPFSHHLPNQKQTLVSSGVEAGHHQMLLSYFHCPLNTKHCSSLLDVIYQSKYTKRCRQLAKE